MNSNQSDYNKALAGFEYWRVYGFTESDRAEMQAWHKTEEDARRAPSNAAVDAAVKELKELWAGTDWLPEDEELIGGMYLALAAAMPALCEQFGKDVSVPA
jgi:hypothetical protein